MQIGRRVISWKWFSIIFVLNLENLFFQKVNLNVQIINNKKEFVICFMKQVGIFFFLIGEDILSILQENLSIDWKLTEIQMKFVYLKIQ